MKRKPKKARVWYELRNPDSLFFMQFSTAKGAEIAADNLGRKDFKVYEVREVPKRRRK